MEKIKSFVSDNKHELVASAKVAGYSILVILVIIGVVGGIAALLSVSPLLGAVVMLVLFGVLIGVFRFFVPELFD